MCPRLAAGTVVRIPDIAVGLSLPGDRPVRTGHRCSGLPDARPSGHPPIFTHALEYGPSPTEVITDRATAYPRVLDELVPAACHVTEHYANNRTEADYGRLKS